MQLLRNGTKHTAQVWVPVHVADSEGRSLDIGHLAGRNSKEKWLEQPDIPFTPLVICPRVFCILRCSCI